MIVVDSSALVAILEEEPEAERLLQIVRGNEPRFVGAVTVYETGIVIGARRGFESAIEVMALLAELGIKIIPFAEQHISGALEAYSRYGKGIHSKARLNLGDCRLRSCQEHEGAAAVQGQRLLRNGRSHLHLRLAIRHVGRNS
jgi:ribonuclease VapC